MAQPKIEAAQPLPNNVNDQNHENEGQDQEAAYDQMIKDINRNTMRQERQKSELIVNKKTENSQGLRSQPTDNMMTIKQPSVTSTETDTQIVRLPTDISGISAIHPQPQPNEPAAQL